MPKSFLQIVLFDPHYLIFNLGISLLRYEEELHQGWFIRKEFQIGLLIASIRFNWYIKMEPED
jgi:hypothetical protein